MTSSRGGSPVLPVVAMVAGTAAMLLLAFVVDAASLDYGVGVVPLPVPWLAAAAVIALAVVGLAPGRTSAPGTVLVGVVLVSTGWSVALLLFDALRAVGLVPLPVSGWGLGLRLVLLLGASASLVPVYRARASRRDRCPACHRRLPGTLARLPRWPAAVGMVFALPYPVMRVSWLLGGTLGTTGGPVQADRGLQLTMAAAGMTLVLLAAVLLIDRGPGWMRALLGVGGLIVGSALAVTFGPAAVGFAFALVGRQVSPAAGLMPWVFALFYGSWLVAGVGVGLGGLRYWAHRRNDCATCRDLLGRDNRVRRAPLRARERSTR